MGSGEIAIGGEGGPGGGDAPGRRDTLSSVVLAIAVDCALLALSLWFLVHSGSYSAQAALFPHLVALPGAALCGVALVRDLHRMLRGGDREVAVGHTRMLAAGIAGSAAYLVLVATLGFVAATIVAVAGGCALLSVRGKSLVIVLAAATALSILFLFVLAYGSGTPPPAGLLGL